MEPRSTMGSRNLAAEPPESDPELAVMERNGISRIFVGGAECGAAWKKTSRGERGYLSVKIDDPSFPAPIFAALLEGDKGEHRLFWSR